MEKIRKRFYWASCKQDVEEWIRICKVCIARKEFIGKRKSPLQIYNVGVPFERIQMDVLDPLTTATSGNRDLLVVVDCYKMDGNISIKEYQSEVCCRNFS